MVEFDDTHPDYGMADEAPTKADEMHGLVVTFGRYKGERWTRLPLNYLRHAINSLNGPAQNLAKLELERRGITLDAEIEVTAHALDRASLSLLPYWQKTGKPAEGLHSWLTRCASNAFGEAEQDATMIIESSVTSEGKPSRTVIAGDVKYVFVLGNYHPILVTVALRPNPGFVRINGGPTNVR
jgi:hypothetical protein